MSLLTEIIAKVEGLSRSPRRVVGGGCVGGGVEGPSGGATDSVVMVTGFGGGDDGDEEGEGRDVRRDGWRHCR